MDTRAMTATRGLGEELIRSVNNALAESDASLEMIEGDSDDDIQHTTQSSTQPAKVHAGIFNL